MFWTTRVLLLFWPLTRLLTVSLTTACSLSLSLCLSVPWASTSVSIIPSHSPRTFYALFTHLASMLHHIAVTSFFWHSYCILHIFSFCVFHFSFLFSPSSFLKRSSFVSTPLMDHWGPLLCCVILRSSCSCYLVTVTIWVNTALCHLLLKSEVKLIIIQFFYLCAAPCKRNF